MDFELQNPDFVPFQYRRRPRAYLTKKKRLQLIIRGIIARKSLLMAEIDRPIEKKNENSRPNINNLKYKIWDGVLPPPGVYVCSACNSNQKTAYQFCEHMAIHHSDPNDRVWKCVYCSTSFGRRGGLRRHVQMVHMQMMHKCPIENCSHPGYKCTKALNAHVRTHTRPFTCDRCDAAFARKNDLQVHQFTHLL
ncbi:hypothetical protein B9Z55_006464 [Caenorhabditis nigoni]|uniref:C2H2-type domain-containing protein n=1 Tax=Caenorhabditis nigoni TaxID=1611254 RepID=A0A2G5V589_9PELO|nr:hypothetical protein B9Z55_006464 [Caenorhabditis nigoni]